MRFKHGELKNSDWFALVTLEYKHIDNLQSFTLHTDSVDIEQGQLQRTNALTAEKCCAQGLQLIYFI